MATALQDIFLLRTAAPARVVTWTPLVLLTVLASGCGNQMFRQPNYSPLDAPRAAPPADAVPVSSLKTPTDGIPVASPAYGDQETATAVHTAALFPSKEPDLPPPNLSDSARYQPTPASVNVLRNPLPNDPRIVHAGNVLFLNRCVQCHNATGYGYGTVGQYLVPHPPDLASRLVQHISDGAIFWHITMGQGKMPGFRHWTTPAERWSLVEYVRSFSRPSAAPRDADTRRAPYPVYGVRGFEDGKSAYPFKTLAPSTGDTESRRGLINGGFGQPPQR